MNLFKCFKSFDLEEKIVSKLMPLIEEKIKEQLSKINVEKLGDVVENTIEEVKVEIAESIEDIENVIESVIEKIHC